VNRHSLHGPPIDDPSLSVVRECIKGIEEKRMAGLCSAYPVGRSRISGSDNAEI
jgi:hypothetical protein